jgi:hypothetical protein
LSVFNLRFLSFDVRGAWSPFHASGLLAALIIAATDASRARMASSIALTESPPVLLVERGLNETYENGITRHTVASLLLLPGDHHPLPRHYPL